MRARHFLFIAGGGPLRYRLGAKSHGPEQRTVVVDRGHDRVQHRVSLDGGHGVVCRGEELERHEGDSNSPPTHRIVRTERTGYHDAHGYIPEADLSLPAGS